jgi:drug/metabolite transporter (DMT)-like permease
MPDRRPTLDTPAVCLLILCCGLWGLNHVATKLTLADVPPLIQAGVRSLGAALLVAVWSAWRRIPLGPGNGTLGGGLLAGGLFAAEFAAIFIGLQHTTASRMVVFIYLSPFVVALGMPLVAGTERPSGRQLAGLALAFAGVAWAFAEGLQGGVGNVHWLGDALGVLAAVLWGATTLVIRGSRLASAPPEQTLFYQLAVSGVLLVAGSLAVGEAWPRSSALGAQPLALMAFQTIVVTFASYLVWFWLVRHYPATQVASFTLLTPLAGLLAGVGLLGEPLTLRLLVACGTVAAGIALVNRPPVAQAARTATQQA